VMVDTGRLMCDVGNWVAHTGRSRAKLECPPIANTSLPR
jgi:hypothetical protein